MSAGGSSDRFAVTMAAAPPPRKPSPGQPWSHAETVALIEGYEEKWFALNRGQLKAQQWEEVAAAVASRCGFADPSRKNGTQCRHKVEKLRKRYRSELLRPVVSAWPYFDLMDRMERAPSLSARRPPVASGIRLRGAPPPPDSESDDDNEESDSDDPDALAGNNNTRSINGILGKCNGGTAAAARASGFPNNVGGGGDDDEDDEDEDDDMEGSAFAGVAGVLRRLCDGFERLEKRRMESMREMQRDWMEMETKREEMMMESQAFLVESVAAAFASSRPPSKKAKKSSQDL